MNKLKPGTWCRPSSEKEWRLILDLANDWYVLPLDK